MTALFQLSSLFFLERNRQTVKCVDRNSNRQCNRSTSSEIKKIMSQMKDLLGNKNQMIKEPRKCKILFATETQ